MQDLGNRHPHVDAGRTPGRPTIGHRWTGPSLAAERGHLLVLETDEIERLAAGLPREFDVPRDDEALDRHRATATPLLGDIAARILDRMRNGPGLAILTGAGLEHLPDGSLAALLNGLSLVLGTPMAQNPAGDRIVSVRDEHPADPTARGYRTNKGLLMHTDAADVAGLLCLSQGRSGGANMFSSSEAVHDVLAEEAPGQLHEYYRLWEWDLRGLHRPGARPTVSSSIFAYYAGTLTCRYAAVLLREGAARVGSALTNEQVEALDRFEDVARRPELVLTHTLRRGESMWLNNYTVLHGREQFGDGDTGDQVRHLLRTWVWLHEGPNLAPGFASPREVY